MAVVALDHVQLALPAGDEALAAAEGFYAGLLGLVRVPKPPALAARGGAWFAAPGTPVQVHLGVEEPFAPAKKAHPALAVDDLDGLAAALAAAGHDVRWSDEVPGTRRFHTDDPFGNRLELVAARA
jgi:hypothetical protein